MALSNTDRWCCEKQCPCLLVFHRDHESASHLFSTDFSRNLKLVLLKLNGMPGLREPYRYQFFPLLCSLGLWPMLSVIYRYQFGTATCLRTFIPGLQPNVGCRNAVAKNGKFFLCKGLFTQTTCGHNPPHFPMGSCQWWGTLCANSKPIPTLWGRSGPPKTTRRRPTFNWSDQIAKEVVY